MRSIRTLNIPVLALNRQFSSNGGTHKPKTTSTYTVKNQYQGGIFYEYEVCVILALPIDNIRG